MPPERFDWSDRQQPQADPSGAGLAGLAPAGIAQAPPQAAGQGPGPSDLVVRTRRSDHELRAGGTYRIGRDPSSEIVMTDSRVSWRHGVLRVDGNSWILEDLGSTNGTFLGLQRVERVEIASTVVVRLGNPEDGPILRCMPQSENAAPPPVPASPPPVPQAPQAPPAPQPGPDASGWAADRAPQGRHAAAQQTPQAPQAPLQPPGGLGRRDPESWWQPGAGGGPGAPAREAPPPAPPEPGPGGPGPWQGDRWQEPVMPPGQGTGSPVGGGRLKGPLPSVDRRPTARMPLPAKAMRIGRIPDNDLVLPDLEVSRHHAELRKSPTGSYEIVDLGSHNGTFVNGQRISRQTLTERDIVGIGHSTFRLADGELRQFVDAGEISFSAHDLVVKVGGGKVLLDHVTFPIPEKCLLGIIGPSGAGKSTLLGALTGMRPADTGTILYDNRDLYQHYAELRYRIGLVPQESVLHTQLTARRALQYSAELRFPADTRGTERDGRVDEVMGELGLTKHANTRADRLSGGQLKRVNVAQELLTKPSLLFLDEPTSGLDPGLDKSVMEQMRDLAHDGRTVIVVTHSVDNLDQCDRLLVLVPGGRIAYYGPPSEGLKYFGQARWAEVFQMFDRYPDRDWAAEYAASPAHAQYVAQNRQLASPAANQQLPETPPPRRGRFSQMSTLTRRYVRVIASDRGFLLFTAIAPFLLGALIRLLAGSQGLANTPNGNPNAQTVLILLVICAVLSGTASSIWELVKERQIYIRERAAGLSSGAYLASKLVVLGVTSIVQSAVLVLVGLTGVKMPSTGAISSIPPLIEILIVIAALGLASMCVGLLVSAMVSTSEKAVPFLVMLTLVQVVLSGGLVKLQTGLAQVAWLAPSRWGFAATASTINFNAFPHNTLADSLYSPTATAYARDVGVLVGLAALYSLITWMRLRRLGPRRRKG